MSGDFKPGDKVTWWGGAGWTVKLGPSADDCYVLADDKGHWWMAHADNLTLDRPPIPERWGYLTGSGIPIFYCAEESARSCVGPVRPVIRWTGEYVDE